MRTLILVTMLSAAVGFSSAGTVTKGSVKDKVSISDNCIGGTDCATALQFTLSTNMEAEISPTEANEFGPNTLIRGSFPLGPKAFFMLNEDPNYQPGDTSIKISDTVVFNNIDWKRNISLSWDKGKLKLKAKITAKQNLDDFLQVDYEGLVKTQTKLQSPTGVIVTLLGENLGDEFLNLQGTVQSTVKVTNTIKPKTNGDVKLQSKQQVQGNQLLTSVF